MLLSGSLVKRTIDNNNEKLNWLIIIWIRYDKNFYVMKFKYSLDKKALFRILDLRKGVLKNREVPKLSTISEIRLQQTYTRPLLIDVEKNKSYKPITINRPNLPHILQEFEE